MKNINYRLKICSTFFYLIVYLKSKLPASISPSGRSSAPRPPPPQDSGTKCGSGSLPPTVHPSVPSARPPPSSVRALIARVRPSATPSAVWRPFVVDPHAARLALSRIHGVYESPQLNRCFVVIEHRALALRNFIFTLMHPI